MDSNNSELELGLQNRRKRPFIQEEIKGKEVDNVVDRISDLPDHIIAQVLSFLEIDEAIRTSILSSRWRYLWKGVTRICLCEHKPNYGPEKFSNLIEHVIRNCRSTNFLRFELKCPFSVDVSRLNTWIGCIRSHKLEELTIIVYNKADSYELPEPPLPQCSLSWSTLVFLKLNCFDIEIPESTVSFPRLKSLDLQVIFPNSEAAVNQLLSCCPVLETLDLFGFLDSVEMLKVDISVSTLRSLNLQLKISGNAYHKRKHEIIINTPNLENLSIVDDSFAQYVVQNLARVSNVYVNFETMGIEPVGSKYINRLLQLLEGITATQLLTLHWGTVDLLGTALSYAWPTFPYLKTLTMHLNKLVGWTCFSRMLQIAPKLKSLTLDLEELNDDYNRLSIGNDDDDDDDEEEEENDGEDDLCRWTPPDIIPSCLLEYLDSIRIENFEGNKDELQVVEYLLNNAQVLDCMTIGYDQMIENEEAVEKLAKFSRASKSCDVKICKQSDIL